MTDLSLNVLKSDDGKGRRKWKGNKRVGTKDRRFADDSNDLLSFEVFFFFFEIVGHLKAGEGKRSMVEKKETVRDRKKKGKGQPLSRFHYHSCGNVWPREIVPETTRHLFSWYPIDLNSPVSDATRIRRRRDRSNTFTHFRCRCI